MWPIGRKARGHEARVDFVVHLGAVPNRLRPMRVLERAQGFFEL